MASRMDKYQKSELVTNGRSKKNQDLYNQINDFDTYSNIEGVATIENNNEIDITKVRKMLENREDYKKRRELDGIIRKSEDEIPEEKEEVLDDKRYDIADILSKIKKNTEKDSSHRSLDEAQYNELKNYKKKEKEEEYTEDPDELKELIHTLSATRALKKVSEDDVGLLDDLKSDTMVGEADSIKKIIEAEKKGIKPEQKDEIDRSFYTSSLGLTSKDFEDLKDLNKELKSDNTFIIVLLILLILIILVVTVLYFVSR